MQDSCLIVFDVQRFSVHDGPGIRTTVFLKGCPLRCRWCQNPESLRPEPELAFSAERCRGARECVASCPRAAIPAGGGPPDRARCDACGRCAPACPYGAYQVVGRRVSVAALVDEIARDAPFFASSGGGLTLSGGEPTAQLPAAGELAVRAAAAGIGVGMQTCGAFRWADLAPYLGHLRFVHYDLKAIDSALHRRLTGADNRTILDNARRMVDAGIEVLFRAPVIPAHNDGQDDLDRLAGFLTELGVGRIQLLCWHGLGLAKLARIGSSQPHLDLGPAARARASLQRAAQRLAGAGLEVIT